MIRFLISIPEGVHGELKAISKERGQTLNGLIRQIIWDWRRKNPISDKEKQKQYAGREQSVC